MDSLSGRYAVYKGQTYKASYFVEKSEYLLVSEDKEDLKLCFEKVEREHTTYYVKQVGANEIDEVYSLSTLARYRGEEVGVSKITEDGKYVIFHGDNEFCEQNGFEFVDRDFWVKKVEREELDEIWEVKRPLKI